ncbi:hypothetical protein Fmac_009643 [Flemingia macrophylla]|uniref:Transmembrane protein n=1 Tax=Flemingia macrophylla TaxID=520843 RepID=A0ABD1N237_9FABA
MDESNIILERNLLLTDSQLGTSRTAQRRGGKINTQERYKNNQGNIISIYYFVGVQSTCYKTQKLPLHRNFTVMAILSPLSICFLCAGAFCFKLKLLIKSLVTKRI